MHGLYSINLERFILLDNDRWTLLHTGKLLSSKMQLCVCEFNDYVDITADDCILWTVTGGVSIPQDQQVPKLTHINDNLNLVGPPTEISLDILTNHINYAKFVLKIIKAAWTTEAVKGIGDQSYFLSLVNETGLVTIKDETWADDGFLFSIDKILYLSNSQDEAMKKIKQIFNNPNAGMPAILEGYRDSFFKRLEQ